ncbi:hypothetical protein P3G55_17065 [Leptospira sp. 96542]|nr:hypothetical protein [Leptospira sp. 96542]
MKEMEPPRIQDFKDRISRQIPIFPNNRETRYHLQSLSLGELMVHALSWLSRYVIARPRKVHVPHKVLDHQKWKENQYRTLPLLRRFQKGETVIEFLSNEIKTRGLNLNYNITNKWKDKDFFLNAMGFHHFHLGNLSEGNHFADRTNEILFAEVQKKEVSVIGIYDHSVFESKSEKLSDERRRLWTDFESYRFGKLQPGKFYLQSMIATSGHPTHVVNLAQSYTHMIRTIDESLDDQDYLRDFLGIQNENVNSHFRFDWMLHFSDLYLIEKNQKLHILIEEGFN